MLARRVFCSHGRSKYLATWITAFSSYSTVGFQCKLLLTSVIDLAQGLGHDWIYHDLDVVASDELGEPKAL